VLRVVPGLIPEDFIDNLRDQIEIVSFIKGFVPLKKQGQNYVGLCPFHTEKTPSFVVSPHKQIFHCFGCGKGGNVYIFVMEQLGLSFPEAVAYLAKTCGLEVPSSNLTPQQRKQRELREKLVGINELAAKFFQQQLWQKEAKGVQDYLKKRGLKKSVCQDFLLGYAPDDWGELTNYLLSKKIAPQDLISLGLAVRNPQGHLYDRFRNRLIFPIGDAGGRIIGFGGRALDDSLPKYFNSPETPLFNKGEQLYGLHQARGFLRNKNQVILTEGYLDVITAHQYGFSQVVGILGTALTEKQARLLMRYTYNFIFCFDADSAGSQATLRGLDIVQQLGVKAAVIIMPQGLDPDDFLRKEGQTKFNQLIEQALPAFEYRLLKLTEKYKQDTLENKIQIMQALIPVLLKIKSPIEREGYLRLLAERFSFSEKAIYAEIKKYQQGLFQKDEEAAEEKREISGKEKAQWGLLRLVLNKPELLNEVEKFGGAELFFKPLYKEIYKLNYLLRQAGHNIKVEDLITHLKNKAAQELVAEIMLSDEPLQNEQKFLKDCLLTLKIELVNQKIQEKQSLMVGYEKQGEVTKSLELMAVIQKMIKERQKMVSTLAKGGNILEE